MSRKNYVFTSESVSEGHPDKLCDRVSDAVLDAFLTEEAHARVACETFATTGRVVVGGEVGLSDKKALKAMKDRVEDIVRACVKDIGYEQDEFHWNTLKVQNYLHSQSAHIAQGVDRVATIASEKTRAVKMGLERDKVTLSVTSPENGTASEELPADYAAADIEVGFNYRYLLDILGQVGSDLVDVHLADASAPTLIRENDEAKALYVLMPMRV